MIWILTFVLPLLSGWTGSAAQAQAPYDLVIAGGSIVNGEGTPAVTADLGIRDGRIASIGNLAGAAARRRIDAAGLTVAPGLHRHPQPLGLHHPRWSRRPRA